MSPAAWDRLADATQQAQKPALSVITLGDVHSESLVALTPYVEKLEQLVLDVPPRDALARHRAEFNRAVDTATCDWVLILREREGVGDALAVEIVQAAVAAKARGFRIRSVPMYAGRPLRIGTPDGGEVRLFHRRYYLRFANKGAWEELMVQGSVVRLSNELRSETFASTEEHRAYLAAKAAPHSAVRRLLVFTGYVLATRARDLNTLRYLWTEAGFDVAPAL